MLVTARDLLFIHVYTRLYTFILTCYIAPRGSITNVGYGPTVMDLAEIQVDGDRINRSRWVCCGARKHTRVDTEANQTQVSTCKT